jgi:two-component system, cell cycle response regulator
MAANDSDTSTRAPSGPSDCLSTPELAARLQEEVNRAERHRTVLSCLLVSLDAAAELARDHGEELPGQALAYLAAALGRQLRCFDRIGHAAEGELLVVLPGADERQGEIVARRALGRAHSVKVEVEGERQPLRVSIGIAAWREGLTAEQLLSQTRLAARRYDPYDLAAGQPSTTPRVAAGEPPALRRS